MIREIAVLIPRVEWAQTFLDEGRPELAEESLRSALAETADMNRVHRLTRELHETVAKVSSLKVSSRWAS